MAQLLTAGTYNARSPVPMLVGRKLLGIHRAGGLERACMREATQVGIAAMGDIVELKRSQSAYELMALERGELLGMVTNSVGVAIANRAPVRWARDSPRTGGGRDRHRPAVGLAVLRRRSRSPSSAAQNQTPATCR